MAKTKAIKIKRSPGDQLVQIVIYIFVGAFALITLLPFVYIVAGVLCHGTGIDRAGVFPVSTYDFHECIPVYL